MLNREEHFSQNVRDPHWLAAIIIAIGLAGGIATTFYARANPAEFSKSASALAPKPRSCSQEFAVYRRAAYDVQLNLRDVSLALPYEPCPLAGQCEGEQGLRFLLGEGKKSGCFGCVATKR